jgi:N-acetylmuramoyl-L-alanine amidase
MPKIAVYAGHGGSDPGAVANGVYEKDINLAISNAVTEILRERGYEVLNNRTTDVNRDINRDAAVANRWGADGLLEIHMNSNQGVPSSGTEMLYSVRDTGKGKRFAQVCLDHIVALGFTDRGIRTQVNANGQDNFGILRMTDMPAVLAETAFINNPDDLRKLNIGSAALAYADAVTEVFPMGRPPALPSTPPASGGSVVGGIQKTLNERYGLGIAEDGFAGPETKTGLVRALQIELNRQFGRDLIPDGLYGPDTRAASVNIRPGARGNLTYLLQAALYLRGYIAPPDGVFGPKTEAALRSFQRNSGLTPDGIAGLATQTELFRQS